MRILVVEDLYMMAMDLKQELQSLGCEVAGPVGRRDQALALAETEQLDGALLDINLNNGDTIEVARFCIRVACRSRSSPAIRTGRCRKN